MADSEVTTAELTPLGRAEKALNDAFDLQLAHLTGRQIVEDGTVLPALARAAIATICEPSEAMIDAARVEAYAAGVSIRQHEIEGIFRAMINAMLSEGGQGAR